MITEFVNRRLKQVSWVRRRDWHILSSGVFTYTNDERFQILHAEGSDDWTLQIKYVQKRDNGTYECQVSIESVIIRAYNQRGTEKRRRPHEFTLAPTCFATTLTELLETWFELKHRLY
ncbi:hypothetical protein NQ318_018860 [Aromia moschata]|uniref:Ig-like domain-containing protein n=1 Tax=Aromia moschata TaxID=1265417 RepID=A0AAV8ZGG0_9CUCU|nr:hypothetical protein NQ318_018860 [Aromia moschata]